MRRLASTWAMCRLSLRDGSQRDALYGIRRLLLMTWRNLNDKGWDRLRAGLAAGNPDGEIAAAWLARELLSEVYSAHGLAHAKRRLIVFFQHVADADTAELTRLARTIDRWSNEVLAYQPHRRRLQRTHPSRQPAWFASDANHRVDG